MKRLGRRLPLVLWLGGLLCSLCGGGSAAGEVVQYDECFPGWTMGHDGFGPLFQAELSDDFGTLIIKLDPTRPAAILSGNVDGLKYDLTFWFPDTLRSALFDALVPGRRASIILDFTKTPGGDNVIQPLISWQFDTSAPC